MTLANSDPIPETAWDACVLAHPRASLYHTWRWSELAAAAFSFRVHRLTATSATGQLTGVLPLAEQKSVISGRRLVSLPFVNSGGPIADQPETERDLVRRAADLARQLAIPVLELRDSVSRPDCGMRTDKITVELALPDSVEALNLALGSKLRSQIRRCDRESPVVVTGGVDLLDEFYPVFAATMRDLGTPVYPKRFFGILLERLAGDCTTVVVRLNGRPAAAAILTHFRDRTEIPWAASLREMRTTSVNMRLYWECLALAIARGSRVFDFGRSTANSGTHQFKLQWGGRSRQLYWCYPLAESGSATSEQGRLLTRARALWSRLPLSIANRLGPLISPGLPW